MKIKEEKFIETLIQKNVLEEKIQCQEEENYHNLNKIKEIEKDNQNLNESNKIFIEKLNKVILN